MPGLVPSETSQFGDQEVSYSSSAGKFTDIYPLGEINSLPPVTVATYWQENFRRIATKNLVQTLCADNVVVFCTGFSISMLLRLSWPLLCVTCALTLRGILYYSIAWVAFFMKDPDFIIGCKAFRTVSRSLANEGEKFVSGDYSRQLMAAYILNTCTGPGESAIGKMIRVKMSLMNQEIIDSMDDWRERRLGYKESPRDVLS
jgi:hypothetical protein